MKGEIIALAIVLIMAVGSFGAVGTNIITGNGNNEIGEYIPGEVIIGFNSQIDVSAIENYQGRAIKQKIENLNLAVVEVGNGEELAFISSIKNSPDVNYAEPNYVVHATHTPNDPKWEQQYGPHKIQCPEAWDTNQGSKTVKIAIVDTGIDYNHEDISGNYVSGGYDHVNGDNDPWDDNGHGTHCAGIAAAVMDNNKGIAGVAQVEVMAEKVLGAGGSGGSAGVAGGIDHAVSQGADVISMSLGSGSPSSAIENACNTAYNAGVLLVAASGNDYDNEVGYPAAHGSVIAVGATDTQDQRCAFSNYGDALELMAPGYRIISSTPGNNYEKWSGTSMATPHVAGVAALAMSRYPNKDNVWIRQKMIDTAKDLGPAGWDIEYGYGLVDARLGGVEAKATVGVTIHKVKGLDDIDPFGDPPEWYYTVKINSQSIVEYDGYETDFLFWKIFHWNSRNTWQPDATYSFDVENPEATLKVKLMDDDLVTNDIADLSERWSDDGNGGEVGRIFTITYNLITGQMTGDRREYDGTWYYTRGDWDGSTEPEGLFDSKQDDAQLWFKISDDYNADDYEPELYVDKTLINMGQVEKGSTATDTFNIKNNGKFDHTGWSDNDLEWSADSPSWISVSPSSGQLEGQESQKVTVSVDTSDMPLGAYSGEIEISSNAGSATINLVIVVPRVKTSQLPFYQLFTMLQEKFPLFYRFFRNLQVFQ
ncbi:MAG: S8 family serine peptidase [Thermoplasmatales archaeon]|nr:S8 family serine peptidase [Thermoplasmatales archaeon]